jgi:hypothetical protein
MPFIPSITMGFSLGQLFTFANNFGFLLNIG